MNTFVILSEKIWHKDLHNSLKKSFNNYNWVYISEKKEFNYEYLLKLNPSKIFIPHWSYVISEEIFGHFECVVFHMTDLPYGRGGSPLQNLIVRGHEETLISALRVEEGLDTGPIYLKEKLSLMGNAEEIFVRACDVIKAMITQIINDDIYPIPQEGKPVIFKRRNPEQGNIEGLTGIKEIYNHIRMLDAEGYPNAFLEFGDFKLEFSQASIQSKKSILANVRIIKK